MTLDEFKKYQKKSLAEFQKKASGEKRPEAVKEARQRLLSAKIIGAGGTLTRPYR